MASLLKLKEALQDKSFLQLTPAQEAQLQLPADHDSHDEWYACPF